MPSPSSSESARDWRSPARFLRSSSNKSKIRSVRCVHRAGRRRYVYRFLLNPASNLNGIIILIGVVSVLFYFFFSVEHSGPGKMIARAGILFLMVSFGAAFGYTVMARMSLLIGRLTDLIEFSDASYGRPTLWLLLLTVATLIVLSRRASAPPPER